MDKLSTGKLDLGHVIKITLAAALGGFLFGFDSSVINGANGALKVHFAMTDHQLGLAVALSLIGMAAFLSAVARTPITATVMVFEMTGGY